MDELSDEAKQRNNVSFSFLILHLPSARLTVHHYLRTYCVLDSKRALKPYVMVLMTHQTTSTASALAKICETSKTLFILISLSK